MVKVEEIVDAQSGTSSVTPMEIVEVDELTRKRSRESVTQVWTPEPEMALWSYVPKRVSYIRQLFPLALCGGGMEFEEMRRAGTYCAFVIPYTLGLAAQIVQVAQKIEKTGTCAVVEDDGGYHYHPHHAGIYLVFNSEASTSNVYKQLRDALKKIGVFEQALEPAACGALESAEADVPQAQVQVGQLVWTQPLYIYLQKRLQAQMAQVYEKGQRSFWVHPCKRISSEQKVEVMKKWVYDRGLDKLFRDIKDFLIFAQVFQQRLGGYFEKESNLQACCVQTFGQCFPELRTVWYKHPKNVHSYAALMPLQHMRQIPPAIRMELKGRMQPKSKDAKGNAMEGACVECSRKIDLKERYCSKPSCLAMKHAAECNKCPECESGNISKTKKNIIYPMRGECASIVCKDCSCPIYSKNPGRPGVWFRGTKRTRPEEPVPEWAAHKV